MNSLKKCEGVPLLNFVGGPEVPVLNFEGGPGVLVALLHHASTFQIIQFFRKYAKSVTKARF